MIIDVYLIIGSLLRDHENLVSPQRYFHYKCSMTLRMHVLRVLYFFLLYYAYILPILMTIAVLHNGRYMLCVFRLSVRLVTCVKTLIKQTTIPSLETLRWKLCTKWNYPYVTCHSSKILPKMDLLYLTFPVFPLHLM